jgi:nucleoside-diphosphate-sugar epimerase
LLRHECPRPAKETDYAGPLIPEPAEPWNREEWLYGAEKRRAEDVLIEAWAEKRFPSTRLRIPMVNGERDHFRRIESYVWRILDGGPILLPDDGAQYCRHVYGYEVAHAICRLLGAPVTFGKSYNLCQDEEPTLRELLTMLAHLIGAPPRFASVSSERLAEAGLRPIQISPFSDKWMSRLDPALAKSELGFQHQPLERYLDKIVSSLLAHFPTTPPENYVHRPTELWLATV